MGWPITHQSTIYALRCKETGRIYIGRSYRFKERVKEHFQELRRCKKDRIQRDGRRITTDFQDDYNKYGESSFEAYILEEEVPPERCQEREAYWIGFYETTNPNKGYNVRDERLRDPEIEIKWGIPPKQ